MIKEVLVILVLLIPVVSASCNGVKICDKNYICGEADGVNPEEYGVVCNCKDPDAKHPLSRVLEPYVRMFKSFWGLVR